MEIIAEAGVNWLGDIDIAKEMIVEADKANCDYVKFQLFNELVIKDSPLRDNLVPYILDKEKAQELVNCGKKAGTPVFFTPMFLEAVDWIDEMKVPMIKIRYADRYYVKLINRALDVGVPVLISADRSYIKYWRNPQIKLLYCVPKYPASLKDYEFIQEDFTTGAHPDAPVFAGVSDHTSGFEVMQRAKVCGAEFCEVHVMMSGTQPIEERWSKTFEGVGEFLLS